MAPPTTLIKLLGEAVFVGVHDSVLGDETVETTPALAEAVWAAWHRQGTTAGLYTEIQALARTSSTDFEPVVTGVTAEVTGDAAADVCRSIINYLLQVPASIRHKFRRPAEPGGTTFPGWFKLNRPVDLLALLPAQLPWYTPGDRPWEIGDWELLELLEVGGFGEVWKACNPRRADVPPAALKFCLHPAARQRLLRPGADGYEALLERVMRQGKHPGLVQLRHVYLSANPPCLEYEYIESGDLGSLTRDWHAAGAPPSTLVADVVLQLARTLGPVHRLSPPIVHRDLRPSAVLVQQAPDGHLTCRIIGLGLGDLVPSRTKGGPGDVASRQVPAAATTAEGEALLYASPQQRGGEAADPRDDVYALGVLWLQMLTGNLSVGRPGGSQWRRKLSDGGMTAGMIELLEACFEDDPNYRPADGAALAEQLARLLEGGPAPASVVPVAARAARAEVREPLPEGQAPGRGRPRRAGLSQLFETLEKAAPEMAKLLTNSVGLKFVLIPAGSFLMGSPSGEAGQRESEVPQHEVTITRAFYLGVHLVTQEQYQIVIGRNPARFGRANSGSPEHPVESVSWEDALQFCRLLSELAPEKDAGRSYRLPTEAEWEYACRAGTATPFCYGAALSPAQANFDGAYPYGSEKGRSVRKTSPVGAYPPNNFGLYDMHGNVWEWCGDWLDGGYYARSPKRDPQGPTEGQFRALRGGSWRNHGATCRAAYRNGLDPRARDQCTGFRVVLEVKGS